MARSVDAETKELIKVLSLGTSSLDLIEISLESKTSEPLLITILPGTIFDPAPTPPEQATPIAHASMVVREKKEIPLKPREKATPVLVSAASIIMHAREPAGSDALTTRKTPTPEEIMKLLNLSDFVNETFRIQQFAIWTLTNNPRRDAYYRIWQDDQGRFRIWEKTLETPPAGWAGSPPSSREIETIRVLFRKAGIPTDNYQALR